MVATAAWTVGIDLGRTKIAMGLIDPDGRIVARRRIATQAEQGAQAVVARIAAEVESFGQDLPPGDAVQAVGICTPGPVDYAAGMILDVHEMVGLQQTPLRAMLADRLGVPVSLDHDAKSAAVGEFRSGAGRGHASMVYLVIGTGVGAAMILDGQVLRGQRNLAGEVGHITINRDGELCPCGSRGCVETYLSGPWLARRYIHRQIHIGQRLDPATVSGELVTARAQQGDPTALQVLHEAGEALGTAIATMAMILDIELYVIGGSVAKAGDLLLGPARVAIRTYAFPSVGPRVRIVASQMGDDAPILGCGWQALER
ncbi:MAG: ROK family protein [Roseiflexaceae bacterium]